MKIAIVNGPNLNLLGKREPDIYGNISFDVFLTQLKQQFVQVEFQDFQSNSEGELINYLQEWNGRVDGVILNAAGYSHTSIALADTIKAITTPVIEVHITNIHAREVYRHTTLTGAQAAGIICGLGLEGYVLATQYFLNTKP